jgi:hypothetical protein
MRTLARSLSPVVLILGACATTPRPTPRVTAAVSAPAQVDGANVSLHQRTLDEIGRAHV